MHTTIMRSPGSATAEMIQQSPDRSSQVPLLLRSIQTYWSWEARWEQVGKTTRYLSPLRPQGQPLPIWPVLLGERGASYWYAADSAQSRSPKMARGEPQFVWLLYGKPPSAPGVL